MLSATRRSGMFENSPRRRKPYGLPIRYNRDTGRPPQSLLLRRYGHRAGESMSLIAELFWATLIVGGLTFIAVAGALLVRRWAPVEVLERHNEVAGFIYSVIGVMYAVLLGFTAIIVWERYDQAQAEVEKEANVLGDLFRDAQAFPDDTRRELETKLRTYAELVVEKEWPAMAEHHSSPEARDAYNQIWQTYYRFTPQNEQERVWYTQSLTRLNQLSDQRRLRMLSSRSGGVPR